MLITTPWSRTVRVLPLPPRPTPPKVARQRTRAELAARSDHVRRLVALCDAGDPRVDLRAGEKTYRRRCRRWERRQTARGLLAGIVTEWRAAVEIGASRSTQ